MKNTTTARLLSMQRIYRSLTPTKQRKFLARMEQVLITNVDDSQSSNFFGLVRSFITEAN